MIKKFKDFLLLEKEIVVGEYLENKLKYINSDLAKDILTFLKSDNIRDDINVDVIDIKKDDNKTLTVFDNQLKKRKYKVGKLLQLLGYDLDKINKRELEDIVLHIKKTDNHNFKVLNSEDDIKQAYLHKNYEAGGDLDESCMKSEIHQKYLELYYKNPQVCSLLVLYNDVGKVRGRALLQKLESGEIYMDRVYVSNKQYMAEFNSYAYDNDINLMYSTISLDEADLVVKINNIEYNYYPFMDTFSYLANGDTLYNNYTKHKNNIKDLVYISQNNGTSTKMLYSVLDKDFHHIKNMVLVELGKYKGEYLPKDKCVDVYLSDEDKDVFVYVGDCDFVEVGDQEGEYFLKDQDVVVSGDSKNKNVYIDDIVTLNYGDYEDELAYIGDCVEVTYGEYKGEYVLKEDSTKTKNGIEYYED